MAPLAPPADVDREDEWVTMAARVAHVIATWRHTAEVHADPDLLSILTK